MLSCLVPPRFGQEDKVTMPSTTAFSLQFPSLASTLHHHNTGKSDNVSATSHPDYMVRCPECHQRFSDYQSFHEHIKNEHTPEKICFGSSKPFHSSGEDDSNGNNNINSHSITTATPSPPISTTPIGGAAAPTDLTSGSYLNTPHQYLQRHQHHQQHSMVMAIAGMTRTSPSSSVNGYDEGGGSTSSPGSSTTLGEIGSVLSGAMSGPGGPHCCTQCSASFPNRDLLEKHELMHSPNTSVSCKICRKIFANVYRLQRHMISHDESALLRKFKCTECDKAFKFKHHLKEHVRIHSGEKPFACDNCGKRFSHSGSYSSHMTSKKCISMGLKLNNNRSMLKSLEKSGALSLSSPNSKRNLPANHMGYFPPGLPNVALPTSLNNNSTMPNANNNAFYPMLPKYNNYDAMNAALLASFQNHFYSMAALDPRIHPYSIHRLLELTAAGNSRLHSDPEDMIEEVTEDATEEQKLVVDLGENETIEHKYVKSQPSSPQNVTIASEMITENPANEANTIEPQLKEEHREGSPCTEEVQIASETQQEIKPEMDTEAHKELLQCSKCDKKFNHHTELVQHEKVLCGFLNQQQTEVETGSSVYFQSGSEEDAEDRESKNGSESERKVRVRTAITEEQQTILKEQYAINARPSRDEFRMIANRLGLDARVVQVWFQNNRSRERKLNNYNAGNSKIFTPCLLGQSPSYNPVPNSLSDDQPLDLSLKKDTITPSNSPKYGIAPFQNDLNEAINLSRKSSRSPNPYRPLNYYVAAIPSQRPTEMCSFIRHTPSPNEIVPRQQTNPYVLPGARGLFQMTPEYARNQLLGLKIRERGTSLSPGSEKKSWRDDDSRISHDDEYGLLHLGKRIKMEANGNPDVDCPFVCDQCDKAFSKQSSLARHKYEHSGQRPYKCEECPKAFKHKHHLTEHKRLHSGEKPFQCTKCLKRFSHSGSYSQHMNHRYSYCKPYRE